MAANHALTVAARERIAAALGMEAPAPDEMLGSMAALPVPGLGGDAAAKALGKTLELEDHIQVPLGEWPVRAAWTGDGPDKVLLRISAQRYNDLADYERLAEALVRRLRGKRSS
jgi:isopenicillin-N epimerase